MPTDPAFPNRETRFDRVNILCKWSQDELLKYLATSCVSPSTKKVWTATYLAPSCVAMRTQKDSLDRHVLGAVAILSQALPSTTEMQYKGQINTTWVGNGSAGTRPDTLGPRRPLLCHTAALGQRSSVSHVLEHTHSHTLTHTHRSTHSGGQGDS